MGGMTRLLLLLWAGVTVGSVVDLQKRIIGGKPCSAIERGYHAYLTFNDKPFCSGSLIHKQWILTAAHCWIPGRTVKVVLGPHKHGPLKKTVEIEPTPRIFQDKDDKTKKHDIMLLKLLKPTMIPHVRLPDSNDCKKQPKVGETVKIAGFYFTAQPGDNKTQHNVDTSKPLQCAKTKIVDCDASSLCLEENDPFMYPLEQLLCYQDKTVDASSGDSGGGVVFKKNALYAGKIYGVHVRSKVVACAGPAKAMNVCSYMDWISETITAKSNG